MYPKKFSCFTEKLNFTLPHFLYIWGYLVLISLKESPDVLDCFGKGSTINESWNSYCVCNWMFNAELVQLVLLCSCHATPALLYCNSGFARKTKPNQTPRKHSSYALMRFCLYADKLNVWENISLHFTFAWNLSLPLLLMRFCSFSWFFLITLGSDITRLLVTFSSRFPPTIASPTEFQLLSVTLTRGSASSPFPYTCATANILIRWVQLFPWANVSEICRLNLGHLHFLGYQYQYQLLYSFARLQQIPPQQRHWQDKEMQVCKGWPGHPLIYFKLCNGLLNAHGMNFHLPA